MEIGNSKRFYTSMFSKEISDNTLIINKEYLLLIEILKQNINGLLKTNLIQLKLLNLLAYKYYFGNLKQRLLIFTVFKRNNKFSKTRLVDE